MPLARTVALAAGLLLLLAITRSPAAKAADAQKCYARKNGMWPSEVIADPTKTCYVSGQATGTAKQLPGCPAGAVWSSPLALATCVHSRPHSPKDTHCSRCKPPLHAVGRAQLEQAGHLRCGLRVLH